MVDAGCVLMAQAILEIAKTPGVSAERKELRVAMALEQFMREAAGPGAVSREGGRPAVSRDYQAVP